MNATASTAPRFRFPWPRRQANNTATPNTTFRRGWNATKRALGWTGRFIRRAWSYVPLSPLGQVTLPALVALFVHQMMVEQRDRLLVALSIVGLIVMAFALLLVVISACFLKFRRQSPQTEPLNLEAEEPTHTGYRVGRWHWNPLLKLDLVWETPEDVTVNLVKGPGGLVEEVTPHSRGKLSQIVRRFTLCDVFGLARIHVRRWQNMELTIRPSSGAVQQMHLLEQYKSGDQFGHPEGKPEGDLIEMRRYSPGDPLKLVLWKVFARTGRLLVRMPERAVSSCERTLAYFVAGSGDEASAGLARTALERGLLGTQVQFAADGEPQPTNNVHKGVEKLIGSANYRSEGGEGLTKFLTEGENEGLSACFLFVPAEPGQWLDRVTATLSLRRGPFKVLIGVDGLANGDDRRWTSRVLFQAEKTNGTPLSAVRMVIQRLKSAGAIVGLYDRKSGEMLHVGD